MFNRLLSILSVSAVLSMSIVSYGQESTYGDSNQTNQDVQNISQYLKNLGGYLGYDVTQEPPDINSSLIENVNSQQVAYSLAISVLVGAIPVDSLMKTFVPNSIEGMAVFNNYANAVFTNPAYNTPETQEGNVTADPLIDQPEYQEDPITQELLNMLGTPNNSYCISYDGTSYDSNCQLLTQGIIYSNAIGDLPDSQSFFSYASIKSLLPQLNLNSLTGPLVYNTQAPDQSSTSSPTPSTDQNKGLQALNQAQAAQNFIRNASGSLLRPSLPSQQTYDSFYSKAMNLSNNTSLLDQKTAQQTLSQFLVQVRAYAAQVSVGVSNLYFSLAKRMPQDLSNSTNPPTSQALTEFQMATQRLFNAGSQSNDTQWIQKINTASPATVQKEIALLLAEINYQLYLNRQIEERNLLTNSVILFSMASSNMPDASSLESSSDSGS